MNRLTARQRRNLGESLSGYSFILPQMLGFILFVLVPLVNVFIYSFQNKNMLFGTSTFCGWDNYGKLFSDPLFVLTLKNTLIFSVFLVPLNLILAMAMALYLGDGRFGTRYIRTIIFLPVVTSGVAWAIVWKYLLQGGTAGPVNWFLALFGIQGPNWLNEKGWAMASVIVTRVLKNLGTNVLIFYGAVMNLDISIVEAARLDGLNHFGIFRYVMFPISMPVASSAGILAFLATWNTYLEPLVFTTSITKYTLPLSLNNFNDVYGQPEWHLQLAATTLSVVPVMVVYLIFQEKVTDAMVNSGMKG